MKAHNPRIADYEDYIRAMAVELEFTDKILNLPFDELRSYVEEEIEYGGKQSLDDIGCNEKEIDEARLQQQEQDYLDRAIKGAGYDLGSGSEWWRI